MHLKKLFASKKCYQKKNEVPASRMLMGEEGATDKNVS